MNVATQGLTGLYAATTTPHTQVIGLCARILSGPFAGRYLTDCWTEGLGVGQVVYWNSSTLVESSVAKPAGASSHYPYGIDVEPDAH